MLSFSLSVCVAPALKSRGYTLPPAPQPVRLEVVLTAYSSTVDQTDSTPFITATGTRVRYGIAAVSRDLLKSVLPYGSRFRVVEVKLNPRTCGGLKLQGVFIVEDTMHPRKQKQIDIWFPDRRQALRFGRCHGAVEVVSQ